MAPALGAAPQCLELNACRGGLVGWKTAKPFPRGCSAPLTPSLALALATALATAWARRRQQPGPDAGSRRQAVVEKRFARFPPYATLLAATW